MSRAQMPVGLPHERLGIWPTPLHALPRLSAALGGPRLLIKRDDLSGRGLGGNKVRKLEYLVAAARAGGYDTLVTGGAIQSNHCRQTAAVAAALGLECHLALGGAPPDAPVGNLLLDRLFGARVHLVGDDRTGAALPAVAETLRAAGRRPYVIPYGGSNAVGACGFVRAAFELRDQLEAMSERVTHLVFATSSGGTQVGLTLGARMAGLDHRTVGVVIDGAKHAGVGLAEKVQTLGAETATLLGEVHRPDDYDLRDGYCAAGYGVVGARERRAMATLARTEGLVVDPVYTGRAFGALLEMIADGAFGPDDTVLFWHTGGSPALFAHGAAALEGMI